MPDKPRNISITRQGQQFGPYTEDVARQFLTEGKLQATDLAWHSGADGWKPLSDVLATGAATDAPPPPPPPDAPEPATAGLAPDTKVHVSRKGERMGPYPFSTAQEYFEKGQLLPDDNCWHDGMDGWKPLGEVMGGGDSAGGKPCPQCQTALEAEAVFCMQCGFNLQTGQSTQSLPTGGTPTAAKPAGPATYSERGEENFKKTQMMFVAILMIVGCAFPLILIGDGAKATWWLVRMFFGDGKESDSSVLFLNFQNIKDFESAVFLIGPLVVGITMVAMAKTTRDPIRCSVAMGLAALCFLFQMGEGSGGSMGSPVPGRFILFFLGWIALIMGCRARHLRPANLPAYIIALSGGGLVCLFWLVPTESGNVPLEKVFKAFKGDKFVALILLILMGMQIAAALICFTTTRTKTNRDVAEHSMLSLKLLVASIPVAAGLFYIRVIYEILKAGGGEYGEKIGIFISLLLLLVKFLAWFVGLLLVLPFTGSDLLTRLMRR